MVHLCLLLFLLQIYDGRLGILHRLLKATSRIWAICLRSLKVIRWTTVVGRRITTVVVTTVCNIRLMWIARYTLIERQTWALKCTAILQKMLILLTSFVCVLTGLIIKGIDLLSRRRAWALDCAIPFLLPLACKKWCKWFYHLSKFN